MQEDNTQRAAIMRLFALADWNEFERLTAPLAHFEHRVLRGPEIGLVMLRGRMGATGSAFNFGEATVTRCSVRLPNGLVGHAYILGRNREHARRAALCDALKQSGEHDQMFQSIASSLSSGRAAKQSKKVAKAAATKVDFFTLVRAEVLS